MTSNFIEHPTMAGEGRCRVCDLPYSIYLEREVRDHRGFHDRYKHACDTVGAPIPEAERSKLLTDGMAMQESPLLEERVEGAEKWLTAKYHYYLFDVLYYDVKHRLDLREFFTQRIEDRGLLRSNFDPGVVHEMRFRYSEHPMYD